MLKWMIRLVAGALAIGLIALGAGFVFFSMWKVEQQRRLEASSQIARTARGEVEYAVVGEGIPVLSLHGNPGGYDQVLVASRVYPELYADRKVIAVSRPGYLRTPVASGGTFEAQADLFAALLDTLAVERAVVFGSSGGGYPALQFALRHPDRCLGLILLAPSVSCEPLPPGGYQDAVRRIPARDVLAWGLSGPLFERVATSFIPDLDRTDARQIELAKGILVSVLFPAEGREPGIRNDVEQRDFPAIDSWPLERIAAPTLLIHGDADENSAYAGSVRVAARVPNAKLVTLAGADHNMIITRHAEIQAHIGGFLEGIAAQRVSSITAPAR